MKTIWEVLDFCTLFAFSDLSIIEKNLYLNNVGGCVISVLSKSDFKSGDKFIRVLSDIADIS